MNDMNTYSLSNLLSSPGEKLLVVEGSNEVLEAKLLVPPIINPRFVAILGHPHSLQGGTMNNKVVTTLAQVFSALKIPSLRFNFRGVGGSSGIFDHGLGESEDMLVIARALLKIQPDVQLIFAGFSFGSYVAYRAAAHFEHALLITVAPPVHHFDYQEFSPKPTPWIILQGEDDDVVPLSLVEKFIDDTEFSDPVLLFKDTGHFFHGKLIELKTRLIATIPTVVDLE